MDPFSLVYSALWDLALASDRLLELVKPGNRLRFDQTTRDPFKDQIQDADMPELSLFPLGTASMNLHSTSCSSQIKRAFAWMLATGDVRVSYRSLPVQWALMCAMSNYKSVLTPLEWQGQRFVKKVEVVQVTETLLDTTQNRNIRGWSSIMNVEIDFIFSTTAMIAYNTEGSSS
jgi:hypothetical protein